MSRERIGLALANARDVLRNARVSYVRAREVMVLAAGETEVEAVVKQLEVALRDLAELEPGDGR